MYFLNATRRFPGGGGCMPGHAHVRARAQRADAARRGVVGVELGPVARASMPPSWRAAPWQGPARSAAGLAQLGPAFPRPVPRCTCVAAQPPPGPRAVRSRARWEVGRAGRRDIAQRLFGRAWSPGPESQKADLEPVSVLTTLQGGAPTHSEVQVLPLPLRLIAAGSACRTLRGQDDRHPRQDALRRIAGHAARVRPGSRPAGLRGRKPMFVQLGA